MIPHDRRHDQGPGLQQHLIAAALSNTEEKVPATIRREDGSIDQTTLVAENLGSSFREFGIHEPLSLKIAPISEPNVLQERTRLLPGDRVVAVNGQKVEQHWQFNEIVKKTLTPTVEITAERKAEARTQTVQTNCPSIGPPPRTARSPPRRTWATSIRWFRDFGSWASTGRTVSPARERQADRAPLQAGDIILAAGRYISHVQGVA